MHKVYLPHLNNPIFTATLIPPPPKKISGIISSHESQIISSNSKMDEIKYMTHRRANFPSIFVLKKADNMIDFQKVPEGQVLDRDILSKQSKTGTESVTYSCKYQSPYYVPGCFKSTRHSEQEGQNSTLREGCELAPVLPTLNGLLAFLVLDPISKGTSVC